MSPIRIGFVGLSKEGWATDTLVPPLLKAPLKENYSLTAVSTTSSASASESASKYTELAGHTVKPYHGDTSQIAQDANVDLVAVAVKACDHKKALLPAIAAGKDVFIEWPAGNGLAESREFADAAHKKGVRSLVGLQGRVSPTVQKVKEFVESGKIGKIISTSVIALVPREIFYWGPWLRERNAYTADVKSGGTLLDIAVGHSIDMFTYVLGDFTSVSATTAIQYPTAALFDSNDNYKPTGKSIPVTAPDQIAFTGVLKSGAVSSITWRGGLSSAPGRKQFVWEIDGEDGCIRIENDALAGAFIHNIDPKVYLNGELVTVEGDEMTNNSARAWAEFAKGEGGKHATLDDAVKCHRLLDAVATSAKDGKRVTLK